MAEAEEQAAFAWYLDVKGVLYYHVPNEGKRTPAYMNYLRKMGFKNGVPDICICEPRGEYHGLYIEMKFGKNQPTKYQNAWLDALKKRGYKTAVCWSADEAIKEYEKYERIGE